MGATEAAVTERGTRRSELAQTRERLEESFNVASDTTTEAA